MRLAIVVVNYRTPDLIRSCLESIAPQVDLERDEVVVVDNASPDDSVERIAETLAILGWGGRAHLVRRGANSGFAAGVNSGIKEVRADAYVVFTSDVQARPGAIDELRAAARLRRDAALIGPRLEWPDGKPQISCFRFPTPWSEFIEAARTSVVTRPLARYEVPRPTSDEPLEVDWMSFACVLVSRAAVEELGLLDEDYFMYFEDVDYCRRARMAGLRAVHWPQARVVHLRGGTSSVKRMMARRHRVPRYYYVARSRYFGKYYGTVGLWVTNLLWLSGRFISLARELAGNKEPHTARSQWLDIWSNSLRPTVPRLSPGDEAV